MISSILFYWIRLDCIRSKIVFDFIDQKRWQAISNIKSDQNLTFHVHLVFSALKNELIIYRLSTFPVLCAEETKFNLFFCSSFVHRSSDGCLDRTRRKELSKRVFVLMCRLQQCKNFKWFPLKKQKAMTAIVLFFSSLLSCRCLSDHKLHRTAYATKCIAHLVTHPYTHWLHRLKTTKKKWTTDDEAEKRAKRNVDDSFSNDVDRTFASIQENKSAHATVRFVVAVVSLWLRRNTLLHVHQVYFFRAVCSLRSFSYVSFFFFFLSPLTLESLNRLCAQCTNGFVAPHVTVAAVTLRVHFISFRVFQPAKLESMFETQRQKWIVNRRDRTHDSRSSRTTFSSRSPVFILFRSVYFLYIFFLLLLFEQSIFIVLGDREWEKRIIAASNNKVVKFILLEQSQF